MANTGLPFRAEGAEYQAVVRAVVDLAKANPSVGGVYRFGGPWQPGISDLDLVIVYRDFGAQVKDPWHVSPTAARIFTHRYLAMTEEDIKNFHLFYPEPTSVLEHLSGAEYTITSPNKEFSREEYHLLLAHALVDIFCNKLFLMPTSLAGLGAEQAHIRSLIGSLYSLTYTGTLFEELGLSREVAFEEMIRTLRAGWFTKNEAENLRTLLALAKESVAVIERYAKQLDAWLTGRDYHLEAALRNRRLELRAEAAWPGLVLEERATRLGNQRLITIPASFMALLGQQALGEGSWSRMLRRAMSALPSKAASKAGAAYTQAANQFFGNVTKSKGLCRMPYSYGFGLFDTRHPYLVALLRHLS